jgi:hypothetical protein
VFPHHKARHLIGTPRAEGGDGLIRGWRWGLNVRAAVEQAGGVFDLGGMPEYYAPVRRYGIYADRGRDEVSSFQIQWLSGMIRLKLNNAFGLTSKATGWAEIGLMISFPKDEVSGDGAFYVFSNIEGRVCIYIIGKSTKKDRGGLKYREIAWLPELLYVRMNSLGSMFRR